jgi:hypothetical protein
VLLGQTELARQRESFGRWVMSSAKKGRGKGKGSAIKIEGVEKGTQVCAPYAGRSTKASFRYGSWTSRFAKCLT